MLITAFFLSISTYPNPLAPLLDPPPLQDSAMLIPHMVDRLHNVFKHNTAYAAQDLRVLEVQAVADGEKSLGLRSRWKASE